MVNRNLSAFSIPIFAFTSADSAYLAATKTKENSISEETSVTGAAGLVGVLVQYISYDKV